MDVHVQSTCCILPNSKKYFPALRLQVWLQWAHQVSQVLTVDSSPTRFYVTSESQMQIFQTKSDCQHTTFFSNSYWSNNQLMYTLVWVSLSFTYCSLCSIIVQLALTNTCIQGSFLCLTLKCGSGCIGGWVGECCLCSLCMLSPITLCGGFSTRKFSSPLMWNPLQHWEDIWSDLVLLVTAGTILDAAALLSLCMLAFPGLE